MLAESTMKCGMGALLLAAIPGAGGDSSVWAQWGLAGLVVGFTLWRDYLREQRMSKAIQDQQDWVQTTLMGALERNTAAINSLVAGRRSADTKHEGG